MTFLNHSVKALVLSITTTAAVAQANTVTYVLPTSPVTDSTVTVQRSVVNSADEQRLLTTIQQKTSGAQKFTQLSTATHTGESHFDSSQAFANYQASGAANSSRNAYDHLIRDSAFRNGVDPALVKAIIHTESTFNPYARSPVGAMGLMQLMPGTARDMGVYNAWDPAENIEGGTKYLSWLQGQFTNPNHVIAAYNAGPGNVRKHGGIPPFRETRNYVQRVNERYNNIYSLDASLYSHNDNRATLAMNSPRTTTVSTQRANTVNTQTRAYAVPNFSTPNNPTVSRAPEGRFYISSSE